MKKKLSIILFTVILATGAFAQDSTHTKPEKQQPENSDKNATQNDTSKTIQSDGTVRISTTHIGKVRRKRSPAKMKPSKQVSSSSKNATDSL